MKLSILALCVTAATAIAVDYGYDYEAPAGVPFLASCSQGHGYCGWYLKRLGFPGTDDRTLYYCDNINYPDRIKQCAGHCGGGLAHCVP